MHPRAIQVVKMAIPPVLRGCIINRFLRAPPLKATATTPPINSAGLTRGIWGATVSLLEPLPAVFSAADLSASLDTLGSSRGGTGPYQYPHRIGAPPSGIQHRYALCALARGANGLHRCCVILLYISLCAPLVGRYLFVAYLGPIWGLIRPPKQILAIIRPRRDVNSLLD